ncbi:MAG: tetratricopeptide repeat protein [Bacteroidales bacterium]|nr:tetratricopeptide repeat protein [Bacteroidales bacterium]
MNNNNPNENHEYHSNDTNKEFEYYKELVEFNENADSIEYLKFAYSEEVEMLTGNRQKIFAEIVREYFEELGMQSDTTTDYIIPMYLDEIAAPMDNLAYMYMERNEYDKALPLLEKTLPLYRVLEITKPDYSYQRYYAMERKIKCLHKLGRELLAMYYEFELLYLKSTLPKLQ